ncbi:MAG: c-type cytochrome domain-containing protein [Planctomycetaceae bacterium]
MRNRWRYGFLGLWCCGAMLGADSISVAIDDEPPVTAVASETAEGAEARHVVPDYVTHVAPILQKYCVGCHNADDRDGGLSLETFAELQMGGDHGAAVLAGDAKTSRFIRLIQGTAKPQMPPEGEVAPTAEEIATLVAWVEGGAKGPEGAEPDPFKIAVPKIASQTDTRPVTAIDVDPSGRWVAIGRFGQVEISELDSKRLTPTPQPLALAHKLEGFPGKVTSLHFARIPEAVPINESAPAPAEKVDAAREVLAVASGVAGRGGVAFLHDVASGQSIREFRGHRDILFDAEVSPNGKMLATCSYDREIRLWEISTGKLLLVLNGHNGAVYDVAWHPSSEFLVSASADDTVKVWRVSDGERMDTLGQPLKEEYCVTFSPDGRQIIAGGADNNIRVWRLISTDRPRINPMLFARFAHEGAILNLRFTADGRRLVTVAEDRRLKVWETEQFTEISHTPFAEVTSALALTSPQEVPPATAGSDGNAQDPATSPAAVHVEAGTANQFALLGDLAGGLRFVAIPTQGTLPQPSKNSHSSTVAIALPDAPMNKLAEQEPNDLADDAQLLALPGEVTGTIHTPVADANEIAVNNVHPSRGDVDSFLFSAKQGEEWVFEVNASRSKSPLDSFIEVLDKQGQRIERVRLQAVKESYFTFRGKDADQTGDFRVFNWEEMELNEFLYANGEVSRLWLYPRGPDSGFEVYPGSGKRWGYFDTTPLSHALGEPCYVVEPREPGETIIPNGLPVFPIYFENDDDSHREMGSDSKLTFVAPADGEYIVRIRDVRGFQGQEYRYTLTARPRRPGFVATIAGGDKTVNVGSSKEFKVSVKRLDDFDGPVRVDITGLPPGYHVTSPLLIEEGQLAAFGTLTADADAMPPSAELESSSTATATAMIRGNEVVSTIKGLGKIVRADASPLTVAIIPDPEGAQPLQTTVSTIVSEGSNAEGGQPAPLEFEITPGETIRLRVKVHRGNFKGEVSFGKEGAGRNLPFGLYVDNIGLNGLLLLEGQSEREFFITAAPWVPAQSRLFHLNTGASGGQASQPVLLHVRSAK